MACNDRDPNCQPCKDCPPMPEPILPRCDIALTDGTFTNATVVVEEGCIVSVAVGRAPQYTPTVCCDSGGGGGGGGGDDPCDCPPGDPGENATIEIGDVQSVAPGAPARVFNDGTDTNAILRFEIPRGADGNDANQPEGVTSEAGGIEIVEGLIKTLPATWPPALFIVTETTGAGMALTATPPDPVTGIVKIVLEMTSYDTALRLWVTQQIEAATNPLQVQLTALQNQVSGMQTTILTLQNQIAACC